MQQQVEVNKLDEIQQEMEKLKAKAIEIDNVFNEVNLGFATAVAGLPSEPAMIRMTSAELVEGEKEYKLERDIMPRISEHLKKFVSVLSGSPIYLDEVDASVNKIRVYIGLAVNAIEKNNAEDIDKFKLPELLAPFLEMLKSLRAKVTAVEKTGAKARDVQLSSSVNAPLEKKNSQGIDVEWASVSKEGSTPRVSDNRASMFVASNASTQKKEEEELNSGCCCLPFF